KIINKIEDFPPNWENGGEPRLSDPTKGDGAPYTLLNYPVINSIINNTRRIASDQGNDLENGSPTLGEASVAPSNVVATDFAAISSSSSPVPDFASLGPIYYPGSPLTSVAATENANPDAVEPSRSRSAAPGEDQPSLAWLPNLNI